MKSIKTLYKLLILAATLSLFSCEDDILFQTVDAPRPQVTDENWTVSVEGTTLSFAEGGRLFRLPDPIVNDYREFTVSTTISSNDTRVIDSIFVEVQHIPSFASNAQQGWAGIEGFKIPASERSSSYTFTYNYNFDDVSEAFWGAGALFFANGSFGITREDNPMRLTVVFDDGSSVRLAQVMFSYPLSEAGQE